MPKEKIKSAVKIPRDTRNKITETAIDLFSREGYPGVSIRDITKAVGIKESSLYHHFASKQEIIEDIYSRFRNILSAENLAAAPVPINLKSGEGYLVLQDILISFRKLFDRPFLKKIYRIISMERYRDKRAFEIMSYDINRAMAKSYEGVFGQMLEMGLVKKGLNPGLMAQEYTYTVLGMFGDYNILKHYDQSTTAIEDLMYAYVKFFWDRVKNI